MLYLNGAHFRQMGIDWMELVNCVESTVRIIDTGNFVQPIKPYLRYNNPANRIIAMPAYVGGEVQTAGIKWIASFPSNIDAGLPRAHSVIVLNHADTGTPLAILNSPIPSVVRTAAVSGLVIRHFLKAQPARKFRLGIIGFGPIGQHHLDMCCQLYDNQLDQIYVYDIRTPNLTSLPAPYHSRTKLASSWQQLYAECDLIITCTVSDNRYINQKPAAGSLLLDISLRDYKQEAIGGITSIIVDDWDEVCRENTDIELLHRECGLTKAHTRTLADVVCRDAIAAFQPAEPVLFCPMGMAVFDMSVARYLVERAAVYGVGTQLE